MNVYLFSLIYALTAALKNTMAILMITSTKRTHLTNVLSQT